MLFYSTASNLVEGDLNGTNSDIFLRDRQNGALELVSVSSAGVQGNSMSIQGSLSADGRFVAFTSWSSNLAPEDTDGYPDVFVHDRLMRTTELVSISSIGAKGNGPSGHPCVSQDGRFVVFHSSASNLVPADTNGRLDVFLRDRETGQTERLSVSPDGPEGNHESRDPCISGDGRYVSFYSHAGNLLPGDNGLAPDVFLLDRDSGTLERITDAPGGVAGNGGSGNAYLTHNGRYVVYNSSSTNLVPGKTTELWDIFVYDRMSGTTERVSLSAAGLEGDGSSVAGSIAEDGRFVAFQSSAANLVADDTNGFTDIFVYDRANQAIQRVSIGAEGQEGNGYSQYPMVLTGKKGPAVLFESGATNLIDSDLNGWADVFLHEARNQRKGPRR